MRSIPPKGSIPPGIRRQEIVRTNSTMRRTAGLQEEAGQNDFRPMIVGHNEPNARRGTALPTLPVWPERTEPEVSGYENRVWVIVELPRHSDISSIEWNEEGDVLSIRSTLFGCPYKNQIALPEDRGERTNIELNNGLFVVTFEKQCPL